MKEKSKDGITQKRTGAAAESAPRENVLKFGSGVFRRKADASSRMRCGQLPYNKEQNFVLK